MKIVILLLMCIELANLQKTRPLINILESNKNIFHQINSNIHIITNKLLLSLKLDKDFTKTHKIHMLLKMHFYLNRIAEKNCKVYEQLKNVSKAGFSNRYKKNLQVVFQDVIMSEMDKLNNITAQMEHITFEDENNKTKYNRNTENTIEEFKELWSKLSNKTIENIINPILNESDDQNQIEKVFHTDNKSEIHDLKTWKYNSLRNESKSKYLNTRRANKKERVYLGKKTKIKNYPFVASIHLMSKYMCPGSIVSYNMVITAASCLQIVYSNELYRNNPRIIFVRVGSDYTKRSGELIPIIKVIFHPKYDSVTLKHNLAIIQMLQEVNFSKRQKVMKIRYDRRIETLANDPKDITVLGWSANLKHKPKSKQRLLVAHLGVYNIKDCQEVYSKYYVTEMNFCAGFTSKGTGTCMGEVGSPAIMSTELVGVLSFGPIVCGMPDAPTVFTKIGLYALWIDNVINQTPALKQSPIITSTISTPDMFVIPLYTTIFPNVKHVSKSITTPDKEKDYEDEIHILEDIIQEFILANSSFVDYFTNGDILEDESNLSTAINENILLYPDNYKINLENLELWNYNKSINTKTLKTNVNDVEKKSNDNNFESTSTVSQYLKEYSLYRLHPTSYDSKTQTTSMTVVESNEFPNDGVFEIYKMEHYSNESSSYYELEIPIDDSPFKIPSRSKNILNNTNAAKTKAGPKFTRLSIKDNFNEDRSFGVYQKSRPKGGRVNDGERYITRNVEENLETVASEKRFNIKSKYRDFEEYSNSNNTKNVDFPGFTKTISQEDFNYPEN